MARRPNKDIVLAKTIAEAEEKAYLDSVSNNESPLSIETSLRLFELYLQGKSCSEIAKYNPAFSLGSIVRTKIEHKWDDRKGDYITGLYEGTISRLKQTALESVNFIGDVLAAAHKLHGEKIKKYLVSGNEADLPEDFIVGDVKTYKNMIETLLKVSGADNKKEIKYSGEVKQTKEVTMPQLPSKMSNSDASKLLQLVDLMETEEKKNSGSK